MKFLCTAFLMIFLSTIGWSQKAEDFIPIDAVTVFSLNNIELLQKISLDELVKYEFMAELQQELFDGSTSGKSIKESGIDFNQKLNVFYGRGESFEISGFSFGIANLDQLFTVFDDFDEKESPLENVKFYSSYFNHLLIQGKVGVLIRVEPLDKLVNSIADSIWSSRGFQKEYYDYDEYEDYNEGYEEIPMDDNWNDETEVVDAVYDVQEELEGIEEGVSDWNDGVDPSEPNFYDLRDSVYATLQEEFRNQICVDLFVKGKNLKKVDKDFAEMLSHTSEGIFYLDNSRNIMKSQGLGYLEMVLPNLHNELKELYTGNKIMGDLILNDASVEAKMTANYGEILGSIYKELNDVKFDKNVAKYIHKENAAYFTYNVDLRAAYEKAYETIMPLLRDEKNARISSSVLIVELLNAFVDKDALFNTYKGSMFGTYNGVKKVLVKRVEYDYDEDFNYSETEVETLEDLPIFTLGFSTKRNDIPKIVLEQLAKVTSECRNLGEYWIFENAILNSVPLYMINRDDLFILTNDEDLVVNHVKGYGSQKISRKQIKKTKNSGFVYGQVDWARTISGLPRELFSEQQNELLNTLTGKTGLMTLTSSNTSSTQTKFNLQYDFNGSFDNPGQYILDMVNSLYILMK